MRRRLDHWLSIWRWRFTLRQGGFARHGCAGGHGARGFLRHGIRPRRLPTAYRDGRGQEKNCRDPTNRNHSSWNDVALLFILRGMRHPRHKHARKRSARGTMPSDIHECTRREEPNVFCALLRDGRRFRGAKEFIVGRIMIQLKGFQRPLEAAGITQARSPVRYS